MTSPPVDQRTAAQLSDIHVLFGGRVALGGVSLAAIPGAITVIAGPNGAGKSTLLEVLAGTREATSGVRVVSATMAFIPQRAAIPPRLPVTVRDVVTVGAWGRIGRWRRMSPQMRARVDLTMDRLEVRALAPQPFGALSGGQQQRTLLAQGLMRGADLLLLDEPTTGLDAASRHRIRRIMREEADRGAALVCVSHDEDVIAEADQVLRLEEGRVAGEVTAAAR
ncbi:zinc ABC transporter ATP-binding protein AztA [Microbacterium sp. 3J1]|uniref:zinc ABC transporter ATP-binding protein AztA n=1 Tax=Microbacterium sp. 3J1 TaxID=861269 RepID=UPI000A76FC8E|nr:zinc ABC transporter ATP-binding protein AztA [Microbacterium sp. 3J1]